MTNYDTYGCFPGRKNGGGAWWIAITLALFVVMLCVVLIGVVAHTGRAGQVKDTLRVTITDTIRYYEPVPKDSVVIRYVTRKMAVTPDGKPNREVADTTAADSVQSVHEVRTDSAIVEVPITQKCYETADYRAYVSGFEPSLDSIFLYRQTIKETVSITERRKTRFIDRFGFGVVAGAGYGIIHRQPDVFIGGAMYFKIWGNDK